MSSRRRSREVALQILYALDVDPDMTAAVGLDAYFLQLARTAEEGGEPGAGEAESLDRTFIEALVRGVHDLRVEIDDVLTQVSRNWRIERMARVDRTILRLALFELRHRDDIPARVTLNEAVELAKRFGAAEAPAFVNGLLDSALHTLNVEK